MKKVYEKPYAYIENFELSQHIASCTLNVKEQGNILDCYAIYEDGGSSFESIKLFLDADGTRCNTPAESFCTYNMADATFNSY